jgi:hypothetical protein
MQRDDSWSYVATHCVCVAQPPLSFYMKWYYYYAIFPIIERRSKPYLTLGILCFSSSELLNCYYSSEEWHLMRRYAVWLL